MSYAEGGHIPGPPDTPDPLLKLTPGEKLINRDGSIWQIGDDGQIRLIRGARKDSD